MARKVAIIVMFLLEESMGKPNKEIEKEILKEVKELTIPWMGKVDKVTVLGP